MTVLLIASQTKTITTHPKITVKDLAIRSLKLKVEAYNSSEKAVIAIPAVNNWLSDRRAEENMSNIY